MDIEPTGRFGIGTLIHAATVARRASTGERIIDIVTTEIGMVVRGSSGTHRASLAIDWPELDANPGLLVNSVRLIDRQLP